jgi:hypothetical protein
MSRASRACDLSALDILRLKRRRRFPLPCRLEGLVVRLGPNS